jgi:N-acetylmuramoyl-L-alanine amidase
MRLIKYIIVHCTAGNQNQTVADLKKWWKDGMGWMQVGYHKVITKDGVVHTLVDDSVITNGVAGYNSNSLHVSYCGGIDAKGNTSDNRTPAQKTSLEAIVKAWKKLYPTAFIKGHRDFSPDKNEDGKITPNEYIKNCPAFEVSTWLREIGL